MSLGPSLLLAAGRALLAAGMVGLDAGLVLLAGWWSGVLAAGLCCWPWAYNASNSLLTALKKLVR